MDNSTADRYLSMLEDIEYVLITDGVSDREKLVTVQEILQTRLRGLED